jgi:hypothetical protein
LEAVFASVFYITRRALPKHFVEYLHCVGKLFYFFGKAQVHVLGNTSSSTKELLFLRLEPGLGGY